MFKVGDKVVCIDSEYLEFLENKEYIVRDLRGLNLIYVSDKGREVRGSYYNWRFITLKETRKN